MGNQIPVTLTRLRLQKSGCLARGTPHNKPKTFANPGQNAKIRQYASHAPLFAIRCRFFPIVLGADPIKSMWFIF